MLPVVVLQPWEQIGLLQKGPDQPSWQWHSMGFVQYPFSEQPGNVRH